MAALKRCYSIFLQRACRQSKRMLLWSRFTTLGAVIPLSIRSARKSGNEQIYARRFTGSRYLEAHLARRRAINYLRFDPDVLPLVVTLDREAPN